MSIPFNSTGLLSYSSSSLGYFYLTHSFEITTIVLFLFLILLVINFKLIVREFKKIQKKTWIILFLIFILGFWLRNAEYRYGQVFDGYLYIDTAKVLYHNNLLMEGCGIGNLDSCILYHQPLMTPGHPYLITLLFKLFGEHDLLAMYLSAFLSSLTIFLIFFIGYTLFSSERKGLYAALIFALISLDILIAPTGSARSTSAFFLALTLLFYLIALKKDSIKFWSLVAITFSLSIYMRQDNSILILPLILGLFIFDYLKKENFKNFTSIKKTIIYTSKKFFIPVVIFIVTQIPVQHWIWFSHTNMSLISFEYLKIKLSLMWCTVFFPWIIKSYMFLQSASILFLSSFLFLPHLFKSDRKSFNKVIFILIIFFIFFFLVAFYFLPPNGFDYIRQMHPIVIPYAIITGFVISELERISKINQKIFLSLILIIMVIPLVLIFSFKFSYVNIFRDGRLTTDIPFEFMTAPLIKLINSAPPNSLIFISQSAVPSFDLVENNERRWVDIEMIPADNYNIVKHEIMKSKSSPMYFIEDYRCKNSMDDSCKFIYENFNFINYTAIGDFKLYKIEYKS